MMPKTQWFFPLLVAFLLWNTTLECPAAVHDKLAIKAGKIIPVAGEDLENGIILIANGKIEAIGKDLEIPYDYWLIDAQDKVIFPGMVQAITSLGMDRPNESLPVTPFLNVYDAIDPSSVFFEESLRVGHSTLHIAQGPNTVIGGLTRVVRPIGMDVDEMTVKADSGIVISFAPKAGFDRMVQMATLRETFRELHDYVDKLGESLYEKKLEEEDKKIDVGPDEATVRGRELIKEEDLDFKHLDLYRLVHGQVRAFLYCAKPMDVAHAVEFAGKEGFLANSVLVLENECYKAVDLIKECGRPVILDPAMVFVKTDPMTGDQEDIFVPSLFYKAGITFAVVADPNPSFGSQFLWYQAARLVRNGIPRDVALTSITAGPASMIGLGSRVGLLMPGWDANLLVLNGDPLDAGTWVEKVFIEGRLVYEQEKDYRLKELLTGKEKGSAEPVPQDQQVDEAKNADKPEEDKAETPDPEKGSDSDSKE
ncbi:MAG: hypothetical protein ABIK28_19920 [Planctomycetota bacterium]